MNLSKITGIYSNEAKGATCLLLQQNIFASQAVQVEKYISEAKVAQVALRSNIDGFEDGPIEDPSNPLGRRMEVEGKNTKTGPKDRVLDDTEVAIMGILDSDGKISVKGRLAEFMSLMTRITKVDHRALCLHILQNCLSEVCQHAFIEEGGLRLLKQWIKVAQEQTCINELKSILKLLKKLPINKNLHLDHIIASGLDSSMWKPLKNWQGGAVAKQVEALKNTWNQNAADTKTDVTSLRSNAGTPVPLTDSQVLLVSAVQNKMIAATASAPEAAVKKARVDAVQAAPVAAVASGAVATNGNEKAEAVAPVRPVAKFVGMKVVTVDSISNNTDTKASSSPSASRSPGMRVASVDGKKEEPVVTAPAAVAASEAAPVVEKAAAPRADRKKLDMGAIARQALATAEADAVKKAEQEAQAELEARAAVKPGKGGLKRAYAEVSGASNDEQAARKLRVKRGIRWADRDGGSQLANYKYIEANETESRHGKYKDMQAKEKQMEKASRNLKKQDSMQKTCEWTTPAKLTLSVEVEEASHGPVDSKEKVTIDAYTSITSDAAYPDVTLIPVDPSEPLDKESSKSVQPKMVVNIVFESGPVGGSNVAGHSANEDFFEPLGSMDTSVIGGHNLHATVYASVPEVLHFLEPPFIAALAMNPQLIGAMLNFDMTPNMAMIGAFRQQHAMQGAPLPPPAPAAPRGSRFSEVPPPPLMNPFTSEATVFPVPPPRIPPPPTPAVKGKQASIPCTWFNTPQGCQKGDLCVYGHFRKIK